MTAIPTPFLAAFALPLALALSACGSGAEEEAGSLEGEPIAEVPAPEGQQWSDVVTVTEADGYLLGNPDAPIKVMEFASLTCPACAAFAQDGADQLKEEYVDTGRVSFELRNQIHGPHDLMLAQLVRCGADETYHPLSDQVWKNLETVLGPVFERQEQFSQALELPEDQRFVAAAEVAGFYDFFAARGIIRRPGAQLPRRFLGHDDDRRQLHPAVERAGRHGHPDLLHQRPEAGRGQPLAGSRTAASARRRPLTARNGVADRRCSSASSSSAASRASSNRQNCASNPG